MNIAVLPSLSGGMERDQEGGVLLSIASVPNLLFETLSIVDHRTLACVRLVCKALHTAVGQFSDVQLAKQKPWITHTSPIFGTLSKFQLLVGGGNCLQTVNEYSARARIPMGARQVVTLLALRDGTLASGGSRNEIRIWDVVSGELLKSMGGHFGEVRALAELCGQRIASGSADRTIKIWDVVTRESVLTMRGHEAIVNALVALSTGRLASGSDDQTIKIWEVASGECLLNITEKLLWGVNSLIELSSGHLVSGHGDGRIKIWETASGKCLSELAGYTDYVGCLAECRDGRLASVNTGHQACICLIKIWDVDRGECLRAIEAKYRMVWALVQLQDGNLACSNGDQAIHIWDPNTGKCVRSVLEGKLGLPVLALTVRGDGTFASGHSNGEIKVWLT